MRTYFWTSIVIAVVVGLLSAFWVGWNAITITIVAPLAVFAVWIAGHFYFIPAPSEDLGMKISG